MCWAIGAIIVVLTVGYAFWLFRDREKRPREIYWAETYLRKRKENENKPKKERKESGRGN